MATQLLPRFYARAETAERERRNARIALEVGAAPLPSTAAGETLAGDRERLRGVPVVARGVGGAIPHTSPLAELMQREERRERQWR